MEEFLLIIGGVILVVIFLKWYYQNDNKNIIGKIADNDVSFDDVHSYIKKFVPESEQKLKTGYTEKSVENQLAKYLKQRYITVTQQHGVADKNARQIDIGTAWQD